MCILKTSIQSELHVICILYTNIYNYVLLLLTYLYFVLGHPQLQLNLIFQIFSYTPPIFILLFTTSNHLFFIFIFLIPFFLLNLLHFFISLIVSAFSFSKTYPSHLSIFFSHIVYYQSYSYIIYYTICSFLILSSVVTPQSTRSL